MSDARRQRVGIAGCGMISKAYVAACHRHPILELTSCADAVPERAERLAAEHGIEHVTTIDDLLASSEVDIVVNLTSHQAHGQLNLAAVEAGRHVYSEKPLAGTRAEGVAILAAAERTGVRVGSAPDRFLGTGFQTIRRALDSGVAGEPLAAFAAYVREGVEFFHPRPETYYQRGGEAALDMGPYVVSALVALLGPVRSASGVVRIHRPERMLRVGERAGSTFAVDAPTFVTGVLQFVSGAVATVVLSNDVWASELPGFEVYGSQGVLTVSHSDSVGGPVRCKRGQDEWSELPLVHEGDVPRGIGLVEMAHAMSEGRQHRASGELAFHVLDVLLSLEESSLAGREIELGSTCDVPAALDPGAYDEMSGTPRESR
jgi:predicted dehydrogenase